MEVNRMKINKLLLILLIGFFSNLIMAGDTDQANEDGKQFADELNNNKIKDLGQNVDPYSVPNYQGKDVPETSYYNSGLDIEDQAQAEAATNDNAQYVTNAKSSRPQITIDSQNDPLFMRKEEITVKATSLSDTYSGCIELPVGSENITDYEEKTCNMTGHQDVINFTCQKELNVSCSNADAGQPDPFVAADFQITGDPIPDFTSNGDNFSFGNTGDYRGGDCKFYNTYIKFYVADVNAIPEFVATEVVYDDWLDIFVNGSLAFRGIGDLQSLTLSGNYKCEWGSNFTATNIDLKPKLNVGWNTILLRNQVHNGGGVYVNLKAKRLKSCVESVSYNYSCPPGETHTKGDLLNSTCIAANETRYIQGFPVYKSCWEWSEDYTRNSDPYFVKEPLCEQLESQGCGQTSIDCIDFNGVFCQNQTITYNCPFQTAARTVSMCGSQLVCPDGGCTSEFGQSYEPATEDFKKAATSMAVAGEIAKEFDQDSLTVFTGDDKSCSKATAGFANCCKDSGWGTDVGLADCSSEEKELGLLKEADRVHFVGNYCSQDSVFGCLSKKYVYCTYPSKLARIIIEQGKYQLGDDFGSTSSPNCSGFTLQELESLDFDAMDLSEFYVDVMDAAANGTTPNANNVAQEIQDKLKDKYPQIDGDGN